MNTSGDLPLIVKKAQASFAGKATSQLRLTGE